MHLQCPNCQKMLSIPDEYAGQMMQCPLCKGTFSTPALPAKAGGPTAPPNPPPESFNLRLPPSEVHQVTGEKPAGPPPLPPAGKSRSAPLLEPEMVMEPVLMPSAPGEYRHALPLRFNPVFLRWMVPVCLILVAVLPIFPWVGSYPGGVGLATQTGLRVAFSGWAKDPIVEKVSGLGSPFAVLEEPGWSPWTTFSLILVWLASLLAIAFIVVHSVQPVAP
jgi:hypothetical protein